MEIVQSPIHPIYPMRLEYSHYIPQQDDIKKNVVNDIKHTYINDIESQIKKLDDRIKVNTYVMEKLKKEFSATVQVKALDTIVSIVLFVVIYIKVYM